MSLQHLTDQELQYYHDLYEQGLKESERFEIHKFHNFDTKFAYHLLRLLDECDQILLYEDIDLQRAKEMMKSVRRGEWTQDEVREWAMSKAKSLETAYANCKLPEEAPEGKLKKLLINCLEEHYGSLSQVITQPDWSVQALKEIDSVLSKYKNKIY